MYYRWQRRKSYGAKDSKFVVIENRVIAGWYRIVRGWT